MQKNIINTDIGTIAIRSRHGYIVGVKFIQYKKTKIMDKILAHDFQNYFNKNSTEFISKYKLTGTKFQRQVWHEIMKIPYGETRTYGEIATAIGKPNAYRAVANACGKNKLALIIPCHRVVGKNNLGGYHWGLDIKKFLLDLEADL